MLPFMKPPVDDSSLIMKFLGRISQMTKDKQVSESANTAAELSPDLLALFPQAIKDKRSPSPAELKEKILELNENGQLDKAKQLLDWREEIVESKNPSRYAKLTTIIVFILVLAIGGMTAFWFISGGTSKVDSIIVCKIGTTTQTGSACLAPPQNNIKPQEIKLPSKVKPGSTD